MAGMSDCWPPDWPGEDCTLSAASCHPETPTPPGPAHLPLLALSYFFFLLFRRALSQATVPCPRPPETPLVPQCCSTVVGSSSVWPLLADHSPSTIATATATTTTLTVRARAPVQSRRRHRSRAPYSAALAHIIRRACFNIALQCCRLCHCPNTPSSNNSHGQETFLHSVSRRTCSTAYPLFAPHSLTSLQKIASMLDLADKMSPEPTPSQASSSHRRHSSKDTICDNSPFINRRVLDSQTEQELRSACRLILKNFKPSDHGMENTDPKLDFGGFRPRKETNPQPARVAVRMPAGAPPEPASTSFLPRSRSTKTRTRAKAEIRARQYGDLPARANSSRKRAERDAEKEDRLRNFGKASMDVSRPPIACISDEDVTLPVTVTSTLANAKVSASHHFDDPVAAADAQASEWMRSEMDKRRQQDTADRQRRPSASVRPPSRAASIKESVIEYVFPGSRSRGVSRAQSKESLRSPPDSNENGLSRSGSNATWRSWGLRRMKSARSDNRSGSSMGQGDDGAQPRKSESNGVNLNRELPPLPSLDSWKEPEQPKQEVASPKSPTAETHIASLMRSQDHNEERLPAGRKQHRRSGSDTLAMQYTAAFPARKSSRKQGTQPISQTATSAVPISPGQKERTATNGSSSTTNLDQHARQRSGDSSGTAHASNFSHRMSIDSHAAVKTLSNEPKAPAKEEQKSKLKKIFSGWIHKKDKKEDWMHKMEKEGIKEGVLVQESNDALATPVVRY
jgi:hypothetical protein